jgi:hypothetical protein
MAKACSKVQTGTLQLQVEAGAYQRITLAARLPDWEGRPAEAS